MNIETLARMDLSQLVCLKVLAEELSVTRTAQRLYLSQSSISKSLAKLRLQFDDPLFIRTSHGLRPTAKTLGLKTKLDALVNHLESISAPETFIPAQSTHRFHIALVESSYSLILPHFVPAIFQQAPSVSLKTHLWDTDTFSQLQKGEWDFGIKGRDLNLDGNDPVISSPADLSVKEIYRDNQVCMLRKGHPVLNQEWDLKAYLNLRHIQSACDGSDRWLLDHKLANLGMERDIAMLVPDFNNAISLCSYTDFVFTAPRHFANLMAGSHQLEVMPLPTELPPMAYTLFWNKYREQEPAIRWMRDLIEQNTRHLNSVPASPK